MCKNFRVEAYLRIEKKRKKWKLQRKLGAVLTKQKSINFSYPMHIKKFKKNCANFGLEGYFKTNQQKEWERQNTERSNMGTFTALDKAEKDQFFNMTSTEAVFQAEIVLTSSSYFFLKPCKFLWPCEIWQSGTASSDIKQFWIFLSNSQKRKVSSKQCNAQNLQCWNPQIWAICESTLSQNWAQKQAYMHDQANRMLTNRTSAIIFRFKRILCQLWNLAH